MSGKPSPASFELSKKRMRFVLGGMLVALILSPFAPLIYDDGKHHLTGPGAYVYYIATPAIFGFLFVFGLIRYRRFLKKWRNEGEADVNSSAQRNEL